MGEGYAAWYRIEGGRRIGCGEEWLGAPEALKPPDACPGLDG
ncbi:hypothetical protein [Wenzhouxiangella marina]|uniref:Uncharacterized protein n=1 Tax=Wenzhouxiangella marina TaxID=1579979 RepID=A0A0K0XTI9_9GAMM|nr:hypothetical protein [Wenzhouxiangella marina]AKS41003.1 hypothetical protein WM2015_621 [Wenzhouxiangella marina]MBB6087880.1 tRNA threonylcarbamoyladenosine biosynthesis protein TsaB [Wenzhouxiangella marina]